MKAKVADAAQEWTPGIKGFDKNLQCRGFQFAIGETYRHDGEVKACDSGFHAITGHPLAVFQYYPPATSRFFRVEVGGETHSDDGIKTAAQILRVGDEVGLSQLAKEAVDYVFSRATRSEKTSAEADNEAATASGEYGAATASGGYGAATASGESGAATASGRSGAATASGEYGAATASGRYGKVSGAEGCALFLVERAEDGEVIAVWAGIAGRDGIKPDQYYTLQGGAPVEVE